MSELVTQTDEAPFPPRFWWLKRIVLVYAALIVALLALRLWWGRVAHSRLEAEIAQYKAAGEPIEPEDFDRTVTVSDEENAAAQIVLAAGRLTTPVRGPSIDELLDDLTLFEKHAAEVREFVEANAEPLHRVRAARALDTVEWDIHHRSPAINAVFFPTWSELRQLAKTLNIAARFHAIQGEETQAIGCLRDAMFVARVADQRGSLIDHLVVLAIVATAVHPVEEIGPRLELVDPASRSAGVPAARTAAVRLIAELLDERPSRESVRAAMLTERMLAWDVIHLSTTSGASIAQVMGSGIVAPQSLAQRIWEFPVTPVVWLDGVRALRSQTAWLGACNEPTWPDAEARRRSLYSDEPHDENSFLRLLAPMSSWDASLARWVLLHHRSMTERRMAATALAIRLYQLDQGIRPTALADLVPDYLPAVPLDAMARGEHPIGYLPLADPPVLYSVGEDGVDNGGECDVSGGLSRYATPDTPFFLNGPPPDPVEPEPHDGSSNEAGDDQDNVPDDDGDTDEGGDSNDDPKERDDASDHGRA